jgi:hypothetical protein
VVGSAASKETKPADRERVREKESGAESTDWKAKQTTCSSSRKATDANQAAANVCGNGRRIESSSAQTLLLSAVKFLL